jgi:hypothetical protein
MKGLESLKESTSPDYSRRPFTFMNNPPQGPFESPQGPEQSRGTSTSALEAFAQG